MIIQKRLHVANPEFILALLAPSERIYFILNTDSTRSHVESMHYLGSKGLKLTAKATYKKGDSRVQAGVISAYTDDSEIIRTIFNVNTSWFTSADFFFYLAPKSAENLWVKVVGATGLADFLEKTSHIFVTYYDHGMELIARTHEGLEQAAQRVASLLGLSLATEQE